MGMAWHEGVDDRNENQNRMEANRLFLLNFCVYDEMMKTTTWSPAPDLREMMELALSFDKI